MTSLGIDIGGTSIKVAILRDGQTIRLCQSGAYQQPDRAALISHLRDVLECDVRHFDCVGLCVPGLLDRGRRIVRNSINVPGLNGLHLDDLIAQCLGGHFAGRATLLTDTHAAAHDLYTARALSGRLFLLALGTGVGASVVDETGPLLVDGESSGHFGQLDVSLSSADVAPIGPDGGRGSLEAYLGLPALRNRYGERFATLLPTLSTSEPPLLALCRAIRIAHAIYRPHHVCITGGIGNLLRPLLPALRKWVLTDLSKIARPDWTFTCGEDSHHAVRGAAKLARVADSQ